jgi:hypothetical protein
VSSNVGVLKYAKSREECQPYRVRDGGAGEEVAAPGSRDGDGELVRRHAEVRGERGGDCADGDGGDARLTPRSSMRWSPNTTRVSGSAASVAA